MTLRKLERLGLVGVACAVMTFGEARVASACGGLFCSSPSQPVNQAAERIVFAENGDGTVTAVIQIMYQGSAQKFSWLLPISSVPTKDDIAVASNVAFQRLQAATNPQYTLTVSVEGTCKTNGRSAGFGGSNSAPGAPTVGTGNGGSNGVTVEASGTVGAFDWSVISVDASVADPSDLAVKWLTDNAYSVGEGAPGLIRPYLQDGLHLLALKLTKGSDVGSIRPLMLTYDAKSPMIPIKLTAVAANDDMGVMTWLLGSARGVPQNYRSLELNEARINWFNANSNYNAVVTTAADEAGGQGFVTEYAAKSSALAGTVWGPSDEQRWQSLRSNTFASFSQLFESVFVQWGQWDGFWDAARATITLPAGVAFSDFQSCPSCYEGQIQVAPSAFFDAIESNVIEPMRAVEQLFSRSAYVTRLYSTLSAAEMTVDPAFTFNPSLSDVSNLHNAKRVIECNPLLEQFEAPWRIELPQGGVIRGTGSQVGTWPGFEDQPSNSRISQVSASGSGKVLEDNTAEIQLALDDYNSTFAPPKTVASGGGGCSTSGKPSGGWSFLAILGALSAFRRRRR
ncbi:MAG TPA: DUF2330 domain-containing protein [Polyangiaceae bacterium]|nr:DUF2330 domain-containing protein [Polyangiaceae bacterium]